MLCKTLLALSALMAPTLVTASDLVMYWGQDSAGTQQSLGDYCKESAGDIFIISFLYEFGASGPLLSLSSCSGTPYSNGMLHCPDVASDIQYCQSVGKKVFLSLGGAAGSYGFSSDSQAEEFAGTLWDLFGEGSSDTRPFDNAVVDGFDFDIENDNQVGYAALVNTLRSNYFSQGSKTYYISAAPQCVYPDASVGDLLSGAQVDYAWIQFYNNYCDLTGSQFNWDTWQNFAENTSPNKDIKLLVGLPGSTSAAGSGYADVSQVQSAISGISSSSNFGGIMLWDASQAFTNEVDGTSFADAMQNIVGGSSGSGSGSSSGSSSSSAPASTSAPSSAAPSVETSGSSPLETSPTPTSAMSVTTTVTLTSVLSVYTTSVANNQQQNNYQQVNAESTATPSSPSTAPIPSGTCTTGGTSCISGKYAVCNFDSWILFECPAGTVCSVENGSAMCDWPQQKRDLHHVHRVAPNVISV